MKEEDPERYKEYLEKKRIYKKAYYEANKERIIVKTRKWQKANPERTKEIKKASREKNREKILDRQKAYREAYPEKMKAAKDDWRRRNPEKVIAASVAYQYHVKRATPHWLSTQMKEEILVKYQKARNLTETTGIPHHVDHIIPLQGKTVRGLHVPWNLEVITAEENLKKWNRLEISG